MVGLAAAGVGGGRSDRTLLAALDALARTAGGGACDAPFLKLKLDPTVGRCRLTLSNPC